MRRQLHLPAELGVTQLLTGGMTLEQAAQSVTVEGSSRLEVVAAGPPAPIPSELLQSSAFDQLLQTARQHYEYVLLDMAPAGAPPGLPSAAHIDTLLLIVRYGAVDLRQVRYTERRLTTLRAPFAAALINGIPQGRLLKFSD